MHLYSVFHLISGVSVLGVSKFVKCLLAKKIQLHKPGWLVRGALLRGCLPRETVRSADVFVQVVSLIARLGMTDLQSITRRATWGSRGVLFVHRSIDGRRGAINTETRETTS